MFIPILPPSSPLSVAHPSVFYFRPVLSFFLSFFQNLIRIFFLSFLTHISQFIFINFQVGRVFANDTGDLGSIPGRVILKTLKMVLDAVLLNTQPYKVGIKGKGE